MAGHRSVIWREGGRNGGGLLIQTETEHRRGSSLLICVPSRRRKRQPSCCHIRWRLEEEVAQKGGGKSLFHIAEKRIVYGLFQAYMYQMFAHMYSTSSKSWYLVCPEGFDGEDT